MKKRILSALLVILIYVVSFSATGVSAECEDLILSNKTKVNIENTDTYYVKVTDAEKNSGNYSLHIYTESEWVEISQNYTEALEAGIYTLTWYAKGTGTIWFYSNLGSEFVASHTVDSIVEQSNGWTKYSNVFEVDGDGDTSFLFHNDGAVDLYIDDISLVDANGVDYIIDGGFEDVKVACQGHVYDEVMETLAPTCVESGVKTYTCKCGDSYTEVIPATGEHTYDKGVITQEPTVNKEGIKIYTCTVCGERKTEEIEKLTVSKYTIGDANEDGIVDVRDVVVMRQHIAGGYGVEINTGVADVNKKDGFDVSDVVHLRQYIAGGYGVVL